jgi:1,4-dihydroxy-2-naphthoate octaprenyltransferase
MKKAMYLFGALSLISGLSLLYLAVQDLQIFLLFLGLGLAAIWASITYTSGKNPYGYAGLGDLSVFIFFGLLGVLGTYFLHTYSSNNLAVLIAVALGFFSTAVLNINNIRDIDSDKLAGKKSIPVRIGRSNAVKYNWSLIILGNLALLWFVIYSSEWFSLIALLASILMIKVARGVQVAQSAQETDPYLKKMAISTLFWVVLFGIGLLF